MKIKTLMSVMYINIYLFLNSVALKAANLQIEDPLADSGDIEVGAHTQEALNTFVEYAMVSINGLAGVGLFTSVLAFGINAFKFSKANGKERADAIENMVTISITTACLGSVPFLMYIMSLLIGLE